MDEFSTEKYPVKPAEEYDFKEILYSKKDWVATITINRPHHYNSYTLVTLRELVEALSDAQYDDGVGVIVLTGAGEKAFCTGGDVDVYAGHYTQKPRDYWHFIGFFSRVCELLKGLGKPTIARINGMAVAGGNEFGMACDLSIAADHAVFRQVGVRVGTVAAGGATQWLPIIVGDKRARELLYLCEPISAQKALDWGLVNKVVPYAELDEAVNEMAQKILDKFPDCLRYTQVQVNYWKDIAWHTTINHAREWFVQDFTSAELNEGHKAFVDKRPADHMKIRRLAAEGKSSEYVWGPYTLQCPSCGARDLPAEFIRCGMCGAELPK